MGIAQDVALCDRRLVPAAFGSSHENDPFNFVQQQLREYLGKEGNVRERAGRDEVELLARCEGLKCSSNSEDRVPFQRLLEFRSDESVPRFVLES